MVFSGMLEAPDAPMKQSAQDKLQIILFARGLDAENGSVGSLLEDGPMEKCITQD
jgi:hypothetical protein